MEKLKQIIAKYKTDLSEEQRKELERSLSEQDSVYPFNRYEYELSTLIGYDIIKLEEYYAIRNEYITRNRFLPLYEITAPRTFGESWAESNIKSICPELKKPSKELDMSYDRQYDLWWNGVKIEIKASRAVDAESNLPLAQKALAHNTKKKFNMNFQQLKPDCFDIVIFVGVWRDVIQYWVFTSKDIKAFDDFSTGQHRGNTGEGQLWLKESNIQKYNRYMTPSTEIFDKIKILKEKL